MLTTLPFSGFYNSWHDSEIDAALSQMLGDSSGNANDALEALAFDHIEWSKVHEAYAKDYAASFAHEFKLGAVRFDELNSPREYNFTTDRIFAHVSRAAIRRVWREIDRAAFAEHCRDAFTSRDGFRSFYDADYRTWGYVDKWDHNQLGALLAVWAAQQTASRDGFDSYAEFALMEDARCNGGLDEWIYGAMDEKGRQCANVASYLRTREERAYRTS